MGLGHEGFMMEVGRSGHKECSQVTTSLSSPVGRRNVVTVRKI